jgi:hypothetical protein
VRNLVLSARNLVLSARNLVLSARNLVLSARNLVLSARNPVLSARNLVLSARNLVLSARNLVLSSSNLVLRARNLVGGGGVVISNSSRLSVLSGKFLVDKTNRIIVSETLTSPLASINVPSVSIFLSLCTGMKIYN